MTPVDMQREIAVAWPAAHVRDRLRQATVEAFRTATAARQRDPYHVGISSLGGCTRAAAYALSRTPVSDEHPPEEGRAANLGTWEHEGLLPRLAEALGPEQARTEVEVRLRAAGLQITGHIDLDWAPVGPVDLKTVGEHRLGTVRRFGDPFYAHRVQDAAYALARLQEDRPGPYLGWHYLDRASGADHIIIKPFTNADALDVIDRVQTLVDYAADPDTAPRDERGPGLSIVCDRCPWLRQCWGEDAEPGTVGAQANAVREDADVVAALLARQEALDRETQAKRDKKDAEARLSRTRYDTYGPVPGRPGIGIKYGRDRDSLMLDQPAARARLLALGEDPPTKPRTGNLRINFVDYPTDDGGAA